MNRVDLHMHSHYSDDSEVSVQSLVKQCDEKGIHYMSITDHNCAQANLEAKQYCEAYGIHYISGIELDVSHAGEDYHLLGYGIEDAPIFEELRAAIISQEQANTPIKIQKSKAYGFAFDEAYVNAMAKNGIVTGEMLAAAIIDYDPKQALIQAYTEGEYRESPYVHFYWNYFAKGKPLYVEVTYPTLEAAIRIIKAHHGLAILAHPGAYDLQEEVLDQMVACGLDGLEVYSTYHTALQTQFYLDYAQKHQLYISQGSDYHGATKPNIALNTVIEPAINIIEALITY